MVKYYIATRLNRSHMHNRVRDHLAQAGHEITYDWTLHGSQKHTSLERLQEIGELQVEGIKKADIVVVLLPGGKGTHTELGIALGLKKKILMHSETQTPFELGEEICAFYCCDQVKQLCYELDKSLPHIEAFFDQLSAVK